MAALFGVVLLLGALALGGCGSSTEAAVPPPSGFGTPVDIPVPQNLLDAAFTDSTGATVHLSDFAGKTVVLMPSMTLCQESCTLDTALCTDA